MGADATICKPLPQRQHLVKGPARALAWADCRGARDGEVLEMSNTHQFATA